MSKIKSLIQRRVMRHNRVRSKVAGTAERPRLYVFRSNRYIHGALVNDVTGTTLMSVTTKGVKAKKGEGFAKVDASTEAGKQLGAEAKKAGITTVVFDRGGYRFTGRVKALAEGARAAGLEF
jgi:large subunit ribosomal protein L18